MKENKEAWAEECRQASPGNDQPEKKVASRLREMNFRRHAGGGTGGGTKELSLSSIARTYETRGAFPRRTSPFLRFSDSIGMGTVALDRGMLLRWPDRSRSRRRRSAWTINRLRSSSCKTAPGSAGAAERRGRAGTRHDWRVVVRVTSFSVAALKYLNGILNNWTLETGLRKQRVIGN